MDRTREAGFGFLRSTFPDLHASTNRSKNTAYWGANDNDFEPPPISEKYSVESLGVAMPRKREGSCPILVKMLCFYVLAVCFMALHLYFFLSLHEKPVDDSINQALQAAIANILAIFVEISLLGGIGVAYDQIIWSLFRQKSLKAVLIDKLITLVVSPWNLVRPQIWLRAPKIWLICFFCALIPFAAVFPPGALTVEFDDVISVTVKNVPTMNISDYGDGSVQQFIEHSFLEMNGDLSYMNRVRPRLGSLASQVLTSGEPVKFDSPCGSSCVYNVSIDGPRFSCRDVDSDDSLIPDDGCSLIYKAKDQTRPGPEVYTVVNNSFKISWYPEPVPRKCDPKSRRTIDCSVSLATFKLQIKNSLNATRTITTEIENERSFWDDKSWIQTQFYFYFFDMKGEPLHTLANLDELYTNFTHAQAYAVRRAAVKALEGEVNYRNDGSGNAMSVWFDGNGTQVLGSPYIGLNDRFNASFDISAASIERYLEDVVISTLSLSMSTNNDDIKAKMGANVYLFNEKLQFFVPYAACLIAAAGIYVIGLWSLYTNGSSARNSFLQYATAISSSKSVHALVAESRKGDGDVSERLRNLELKFGNVLVMTEDGSGRRRKVTVQGFGTREELRE